MKVLKGLYTRIDIYSTVCIDDNNTGWFMRSGTYWCGTHTVDYTTFSGESCYIDTITTSKGVSVEHT